MSSDLNVAGRMTFFGLVVTLLMAIAMITVGLTAVTLVLLKAQGWLLWGWPVVLFPILVEFSLVLLYVLTRRSA